MTLLEKVEKYNLGLKARGIPMTSFDCPRCGGEIETQTAPPGETWDTLATCPHCERLYFKITKGPNACGKA